ncbi:MAG: PilZ domain-containing protein [Acidobacteriota bacterium]|nr:PilZ domain-containing protein [Acidobacteriota bacterium]
MEERRKAERIDLHLPAQWETTSGVHEGTIINCSAGGCFVKAQVEEPSNEPMKLAIKLPNGRDIHLLGEVAYYLPTMGFGFQCVSSSDEERAMLDIWVAYLRAVHSSNHPTNADTKAVTT